MVQEKELNKLENTKCYNVALGGFMACLDFEDEKGNSHSLVFHREDVEFITNNKEENK